ncbi:hypothetical protein [Streptomyces avicenniae]|uniref:hypothetical protein n=1 Tax=Streptomyces avicenniae TaxID=500153 RepID=UPI00069BF2BF|nr:hypothetical protein [Streptomyces avicenniae]
MGIDDVTREHLVQTLAECDALGRKPSVVTYRIKPVRSHLVLRDGRLDDSGAVVGVAYPHATFGPRDQATSSEALRQVSR